MTALLAAGRGAVGRAAVGEKGFELQATWTAHDSRSLGIMHIMLLQFKKGKSLCVKNEPLQLNPLAPGICQQHALCISSLPPTEPAGNGVCWPVFSIIFGDFADTFGTLGKAWPLLHDTCTQPRSRTSDLVLSASVATLSCMQQQQYEHCFCISCSQKSMCCNFMGTFFLGKIAHLRVMTLVFYLVPFSASSPTFMDDVQKIALDFVYLAIGSAAGSFLQCCACSSQDINPCIKRGSKLVVVKQQPEDQSMNKVGQAPCRRRSMCADAASKKQVSLQGDDVPAQHDMFMTTSKGGRIDCHSLAAKPLADTWQPSSCPPFGRANVCRVAAGCGLATDRPVASACCTSRPPSGRMWASLTQMQMQ
eukprot:scaffold68985_cov16-Tisochrysis_lutea.AAC.1